MRHEVALPGGRPVSPSGSSVGTTRALPVLSFVALLCLLVVVAYAPVRHGGFVFDDHALIETNTIVERGSPTEIFSTGYRAGARSADQQLYRPLVIWSFALERQFVGASVGFSHGVNVALHLLVSLTLFVLIRRLGLNDLVAATATLLFGLHPVHVEAVANLVGRAELLAALFSLLALWCWTHTGPLTLGGPAESPAGGRRRVALYGAALCLFLALCSKEVAFATPGLMVALELWMRRDVGSRGWVRAAVLAPCVLALVLYFVLRVAALETLVPLQQVQPAENLLVSLGGVERLATSIGLVARYAALLVYPIGLSADYSGPVIDIETQLISVRPMIGSLLLLLVVGYALRPLRGRARQASRRENAGRVSYAALLLLLPYAVVGNLFFNVGAVLAERLIYLPSVGFCVLASLALVRLPGDAKSVDARKRTRPNLVAVGILVVLVAAYGSRTWSRCLDWRNDETLFRAAVVEQPRSPRAHYFLGKIHADRDEVIEATTHLDEASRLDPSFASPRFEKGVLLGRLRRFDEAETSFREAIGLIPEFARGHYSLALTLRPTGRVEEAARELRRAVLWDPALSSAWAEWGHLELERKRGNAARFAYRRAIALGRRDLVPRLEEAERLRVPQGEDEALQ
jgi:tetratricopeptide (TPR) repeat protein